MSKLKLPRLNSVTLSGRLTRDIEIRYTPKGTPCATISLAFDRSYKDDKGEYQTTASFLDVVAWGKTGEIASEKLRKGSPCIVEGYLQTRTYTDKQGVNRKICEIVAERIFDLEMPDKTGNSPDDSYNTTAEEYTHQPTIDDDVPF